MLFHVYDSMGAKRSPVDAENAQDAINKARSPVNRFPMVVSEREYRQQQDDSYHWLAGEYHGD